MLIELIIQVNDKQTIFLLFFQELSLGRISCLQTLLSLIDEKKQVW